MPGVYIVPAGGLGFRGDKTWSSTVDWPALSNPV